MEIGPESFISDEHKSKLEYEPQETILDVHRKNYLSSVARLNQELINFDEIENIT